MAITDDVLAEIDDDTLSTIADRLGIDQAQARAVVADAVPALVGGLGNNVQSEDGAASLARALGDHADAQPLSNLDDLVGGLLGGGILKHVFGDKVPDVSDAIGSKNGTSGVDAQRILAVVAPIVMAILAKKLGGQAGGGAAQQQPDLGSILGSILGGR
ncbi:DUF937 domain-containing protein [Aeromicrobium terrae]|uniref:DUF937 domain-containing protein n=1 Tax=Aeromicrobium terrae TaxID=2498846 RepID=A0A5C8NH50_9ACTN|nr:DUF937 domain-containing protein [Aeromicrobium terrae]TXL60580.1 DUF937 domain-containing protein [Aeromicrobium terrae]